MQCWFICDNGSSQRNMHHYKLCSCPDICHIQVPMEFEDDVSLKKQLKLLKEKSKRDKKRVDFREGVGVQDAEKEMERLCQMKDKIEKLKQVILRFQCDKTNQRQDDMVIYVPVAELREKGWFCTSWLLQSIFIFILAFLQMVLKNWKNVFLTYIYTHIVLSADI